MKKIKIDVFVLLMVCAIGIALLVPWPAGESFPLDLTLCTRIGIVLVFFLHGANLEPASLIESARNWRAHALTQLITFVLFPSLGLLTFILSKGFLTPELRLGFFFLAALPSTISSSIALTAMGRGSIPIAVFNATLSSLLGMILTPALIAVVSSATLGSVSVIDSMIDIARTLLVPFLLGQVLRPVIRGTLSKKKRLLSRLDRGVILLIIYVSFAKTTLGGIWIQFSVLHFVATALIVLAMLTITLLIAALLSRRLHLSRDVEVAVLFCGATKSLANGAPIAQILFAGSAQLGLLMLPLMLYHQAQLIVCATIAQRYAEMQTADVPVL
jgi:sodium/bile acid cotransporter 7